MYLDFNAAIPPNSRLDSTKTNPASRQSVFWALVTLMLSSCLQDGGKLLDVGLEVISVYWIVVAATHVTHSLLQRRVRPWYQGQLLDVVTVLVSTGIHVTFSTDAYFAELEARGKRHPSLFQIAVFTAAPFPVTYAASDGWDQFHNCLGKRFWGSSRRRVFDPVERGSWMFFVGNVVLTLVYFCVGYTSEGTYKPSWAEYLG